MTLEAFLLENTERFRHFGLTISRNPDLTDELIAEISRRWLAGNQALNANRFMTAMRNALADMRRRDGCWPSLDALLNESLTFADSVRSPENVEACVMLQDERGRNHAKINRIMQLLPIDHRLVLVMSDKLDHPIEEIAIMLKIPPATVRSRLYRARASFQKIWYRKAGRPKNAR